MRMLLRLLQAYYAKMPFMALPFSPGQGGAIARAKEAFPVGGIPAVVLLDPQGRVINRNARGSIAADRSGSNFPWIEK